MKTTLLIICCLIIFGCETKKPGLMNTKVTYTIEALQIRGAKPVSPLLLALMNDWNNQRVVYTNGKKSCMKQSNEDYYFKGILTSVKNSVDKTAFYSEPFPYLTFWSPIPYHDIMPTNEESVFVDVKFL